MKTKEIILNESLKLFAQKGYDAVGVAEIAEAVGIKAPSLYKHYKSKREIFESILARMSANDAEKADDYAVPPEKKKDFDESYENVLPSDIKSYTKAMFLYWTKEEFSCNFRRMLTVEQYKTSEMGALYQQYIAGGPVTYMADIFLKKAGTEEKAYMLAVEFYSPMHLMYSLYDGGVKAEKILNLLEKHMDNFFAAINS